ncbi:MAG: hypothetical protein AB4290_19700, partial [Spirulina sp.]
AYHNTNNPLQSALILANEQEFTLEDIFHNEALKLSKYFLIPALTSKDPVDEAKKKKKEE